MKKHYSPRDIKYDPKPIRNKNIWMREVEQSKEERMSSIEVLGVIAILAILLAAFVILGV